MSASTRINWIDVARGIGIILVVYGHVVRGLDARQLVAGEWVRLNDTAIYAFHMPLFFFLTGLMVQKGLDRNRVSFMKDKIPTLIYPYILWSVVQTVLAHFATPGSTTDVGMGALAHIFTTPIAEFWFLYALFGCHVFLALFWRQKWLIYGLALVGVLRIPLPLPYMINISLSFFPYVVAGWLASGFLLDNAKQPTNRQFAALAASASIAFLGLFFARYLSVLPAANPALEMLLAFTGIALIIGLSGLIAHRASTLVIIGQASMAIYLLHTIIIGGVRLAEIKLGLTSQPLLVLSLTVAGVVFPMLIFAVTSRFGISLWCGLARDHPAWTQKPDK